MTATDICQYKKGAGVWIPDKDEVWAPALIDEDFDGQFVVVRLEDGQIRRIRVGDVSNDLPHLRNPEFLADSNDLTSLSHLHEPDVLYSLKIRYEMGTIYTYCGIVLLAVNPYKDCDIYGKSIFGIYRDQNVRQLDPHIYAVAEEAFISLTRYDKSQAIIISGESGAGKTVSAKYVMNYLAKACSGSLSESRNKLVEDQVLASNPIMEAIGNAKTIRNDNSSRFGKFIQLMFDQRPVMCGAYMRTYLLEKSRVVGQAHSERNYHIFYQMCASREHDLELKKLSLLSAESYDYLNNGGSITIDGVDDASCFEKTKAAMMQLGFTSQELVDLSRVLAGILYFGNIQFSSNGEESTISDSSSEAALKACCQLWSVDENELRHWLCHRLIIAPGETLTKSLNKLQAKATRDASAKHVYAHVFDWIVERMNLTLSNELTDKSSSRRFIGVLDIYGFEIFDTNGFEQLCINYANEMLQQQFTQHVFKLEQQEYEKEGINWSRIDFNDNQPCLDLLEGKLGMLDLLDQECKRPPSSDENWLNNMINGSRIQQSPFFSVPRIRRKPLEFLVRHFASDVTYNAFGFVEKNLDPISAEQFRVFSNSSLAILSGITSGVKRDTAASTENGRNLKHGSHNGTDGHPQQLNKKSLGTQFRESLSELKSALDSTMPHYVRCIKPNDQKAASMFYSIRVVEQLRACGVIETVRISAAGYPSRWTYDEFRLRYRLLYNNHKDKSTLRNSKLLSDRICKLFLQDGVYALGSTKAFFRAGQVAYLESLRTDKMRTSAVIIQKIFRGYMCRKRYVCIRSALCTIQNAGRAWMAYRYIKFIQMYRASVVLQSSILSYVKRKKYLCLRRTCIAIQCHWRGKVARQTLFEMRCQQKIIVIQRFLQTCVARRAFLQKRRAAIVIQCWTRRWLAKQALKRLKAEARTVSHWQNLNKGLENKIISLQQRLNHTVQEYESIRHNNEVVALSKHSEFNDVLRKCDLLEQQLAAALKELELNKSDFDHISSDYEARLSQEKLLNEAQRNAIELLEKNLNEERAERIRLQQEMDHYSNSPLELSRMSSLASRKDYIDHAASYSSFTYGIPPNAKSGDAYSSTPKSAHEHGQKFRISDMEARIAQLTRERDDLLAKLENERLAGDIAHLLKRCDRILFSQFFERAQVESLERENAKLRQEVDRLVNGSDKTAYITAQDVEVLRRREENTLLRSILQQQFELQGMSVDSSHSVEQIYSAYTMQQKQIRSLVLEIDDRETKLLELQEQLDRNPIRIHSACDTSTIFDSPDIIGREEANDRDMNDIVSENLELRKRIDRRNKRIRYLKSLLKHENVKENILDSGVSSAVGLRSTLGMVQVIDVPGFIGKLFEPTNTANVPSLLASYILFMAIRYEDHRDEEKLINILYNETTSQLNHLLEVVQTLDTYAFTLSNMWSLYQLFCQYSGEEVHMKYNTATQNQHCLQNYDSVLLREELKVFISKTFSRLVTDILEPILIQKIGPAMLEYRESIRDALGIETTTTDAQPAADAMRLLLEQLNFFHEKLTQVGIEYSMLMQVFRELVSTISSTALNQLMFRRDLCSFSSGVNIKHNINLVQDWLKDRNLFKLSGYLEPLMEASHLLQSRKSEQDIDQINEMCSHLNVPQICRLLSQYSHADGIERKLSPNFIKLVETRLREARRTVNDANDLSIVAPDKIPDIEFSFCPSPVVLSTVNMPVWLTPFARQF